MKERRKMITDEQLIATTEELIKAKNVLTNIKNWNFATCGPYKLQDYEARDLAVARDLIGHFIFPQCTPEELDKAAERLINPEIKVEDIESIYGSFD